jgi:hypothetical protein
MKNGDRWNELVQQAASLGCNLTECTKVDRESILRVKKCAVALLGSEVQGTEAVMQAFLKLVFRNHLGILVVTRTKTLQTSQPAKRKGRPQFQYRLLESQPLVSPEALLLVMVDFQQLDANEETDAVIRSKATDELKHGGDRTKTRASCRLETEDATPSNEMIEQTMREIKIRNFEATFNKSHFEGSLILNDANGAYFVCGHYSKQIACLC